MPEPRYDAYYYAHDCGTPYERNEAWLSFFDRVAEHIVRSIGPASVLDAGCAFGFLVEKLRERGVEAWGIDISEHAIANADPAVAPYCRVGSVLEPFGRRFDLVVCVEVLEHLSAVDGRAAIANFAAHSDDVLFSSSPDDFKELTHLNVQPPDVWVRMFAEEGLYCDPEFDANFLTGWARRCRRTANPISQVVAAYDRRLWRLEREALARRDLAFEQRAEIVRLEAQAIDLRRRREDWERAVAALRAENTALRHTEYEVEWRRDQVAVLQHWHDSVVASPAWQLVQRLQAARAGLAPPGSGRERALDGALRRLGLSAGPLAESAASPLNPSSGDDPQPTPEAPWQ